MRSPDRLSQRRGTESGAARKEGKSVQEILLEPNSDWLFLPQLIFRRNFYH
jgi:hypothetical protein